MTEDPPTVFIVDDDPSARRGLTRLVRAAGMKAEAFDSAAGFLASEHGKGPGCIVLDFKMPGMTGSELQEELCKDEYSMPIVFISAHADVPIAAKSMKNGAVDFLTKPVDRDDLLQAIGQSLKRDQENRKTLAELAAIRERLADLTPREHETMRYVITGMLNKQIAAELEISEETVKIHRGRVMQKLATASVPELVRLCEKAKVTPGEPGGK